jgi:hypothetical protein
MSLAEMLTVAELVHVEIAAVIVHVRADEELFT